MYNIYIYIYICLSNMERFNQRNIIKIKRPNVPRMYAFIIIIRSRLIIKLKR